jgi:hypothetical protein
VGVGVGFLVVHFGHGSHAASSTLTATLSAKPKHEFQDRDAM